LLSTLLATLWRIAVRHLRIVFCFWFFLIGLAAGSSAQQYKIANRISFEGDSGWDYLFADSVSRKLYVTHGNQVEIIDLDSQKPSGKISGLTRVHGVAIADDLNRGFISDGGANVVVVFNTKSDAELQRVKAGSNPDGIVYDAPSKRVFAFNGGSQDATVIDAPTGSVAGTIALGGKPEFPVSDGRGNVFANIEDKSEIVKIDAKTMQVVKRWPLAPCEEPSGLAMDRAHARLFAVCSNQMMAVVDADSGKVVATVPIGHGPDAVAFDVDDKAQHGLIFSSNGQDGTLTVIKEESADKYSVIETDPTEKSARTLALDSKTHNIYLSAAQLAAPPAATAENPHPRPKIVGGSFHVLVVSPTPSSPR
jgi:DNA-binding beta-propeller fold protein YncE